MHQPQSLSRPMIRHASHHTNAQATTAIAAALITSTRLKGAHWKQAPQKQVTESGIMHFISMLYGLSLFAIIAPLSHLLFVLPNRFSPAPTALDRCQAR